MLSLSVSISLSLSLCLSVCLSLSLYLSLWPGQGPRARRLSPQAVLRLDSDGARGRPVWARARPRSRRPLVPSGHYVHTCITIYTHIPDVDGHYIHTCVYIHIHCIHCHCIHGHCTHTHIHGPYTHIYTHGHTHTHTHGDYTHFARRACKRGRGGAPRLLLLNSE